MNAEGRNIHKIKDLFQKIISDIGCYFTMPQEHLFKSIENDFNTIKELQSQINKNHDIHIEIKERRDQWDAIIKEAEINKINLNLHGQKVEIKYGLPTEEEEIKSIQKKEKKQYNWVEIDYKIPDPLQQKKVENELRKKWGGGGERPVREDAEEKYFDESSDKLKKKPTTQAVLRETVQLLNDSNITNETTKTKAKNIANKLNDLREDLSTHYYKIKKELTYFKDQAEKTLLELQKLEEKSAKDLTIEESSKITKLKVAKNDLLKIKKFFNEHTINDELAEQIVDIKIIKKKLFKDKNNKIITMNEQFNYMLSKIKQCITADNVDNNQLHQVLNDIEQGFEEKLKKTLNDFIENIYIPNVNLLFKMECIEYLPMEYVNTKVLVELFDKLNTGREPTKEEREKEKNLIEESTKYQQNYMALSQALKKVEPNNKEEEEKQPQKQCNGGHLPNDYDMDIDKIGLYDSSVFNNKPPVTLPQKESINASNNNNKSVQKPLPAPGQKESNQKNSYVEQQKNNNSKKDQYNKY